MKILHLLIILISLCPFSIEAQKTDTLYYNEEWHGCDVNNASYYRILTVNSNNEPVGEIRDFYITGELQGLAEGAKKIDVNDDRNSIFTGTLFTKFKNGNYSSFRTNSAEGIPIRAEIHFENGAIRSIYLFDEKGQYRGIEHFYKSGNLYRRYDFINGKMANNFYIEYDEMGHGKRIFEERFDNLQNPNNWDEDSNDRYIFYIEDNEGLEVTNRSNSGLKNTIYFPLSQVNDYSIETTIVFISGDNNSGHGLIWGFKDWDNYYSFIISKNGYYKVNIKIEGISTGSTEWIYSKKVNQDLNNDIKVIKLSNDIYYSINGEIVNHSSDFGLRGQNVGFYFSSGQKKVLFKNLKITEDIDSELTETNPPKSDDWTGSGSGVILSRDGLVATNYHVIEDASIINIETHLNGEIKSYPATVLVSDKQNDLAILKIDTETLIIQSTIPYSFNGEIVDVGTYVFAMGYPLTTIMGNEVKFTDGRISSKTGFQGEISTYQMTTPIQPGNSGGPLFDLDGNLIGINNAKIRADLAENVSYSIKSNYLKNLINVLPQKLSFPYSSSLSTKPLTEKIKILSDFVVLIKVK